MNKTLVKKKAIDLVEYIDLLNFKILELNGHKRENSIQFDKLEKNWNAGKIHQISVIKLEQLIKDLFRGDILDSKDKEILYTELLEYFNLCKVEVPLKNYVGWDEQMLSEVIKKNLNLLNDLIEYCNDYLHELNSAGEEKLNNQIKEESYTGSTSILKTKKKKIKLNIEINNVAYLFYKLRENHLIESNFLGKALSETFINDEGKEIGNDLFNKYFKEFNEKNYPSKANQIENFIKSIL